jgi:hypothetical protein
MQGNEPSEAGKKIQTRVCTWPPMKNMGEMDSGRRQRKPAGDDGVLGRNRSGHCGASTESMLHN